MNKAPLQTTGLAVVALAVLASPASAKFEVGISGYMEQWFGYSDNTDTSNPNSDVFDEVSDVLFAVEFSQEFENGIELGGAIEVLGHQGAADNIDGQSLYIEGSFGQLSVGTGDGASAAMHLGAVSNGIGLDDGDASIWVAGADEALSITSATSSIDEGANKITYYSPRINGLQVGASFMPDADDVNAVTPATAGQELDARRDNSFAV
ncbi:MAG: porin, partial [Alphaproteobacteria bacterium]|nr:porin [Alphaproteobacteria bacterium]